MLKTSCVVCGFFLSPRIKSRELRFVHVETESALFQLFYIRRDVNFRQPVVD